MPKKIANPVSKKKNQSYLLVYLIGTIGLISLLNSSIFSSQLDFILAMYAEISAVILNIFGQGVSVIDGNTLYSATNSVTIQKGCDAVTPMILYVVAVLAMPFSLKHRIRGVLTGIAILFVLNIIRIISLFFIKKYMGTEVFDIFHVGIWQVLFIILTIILWACWVRKSMQKSQI